jgi:protein-arginine kinase activator protein McsA
MKCPKCATKKSMGNAQALVNGKLVPTYICTTCGCNILKEINYDGWVIEK